MLVKDLGEEKVIELIKSTDGSTDGFSNSNIIAGIGDDAAVIDAGNKYNLLTTDMLVEGVHFDLGFTDAYSLGYKALAVNLSDIAAMGGRPLYYLVSVALPGATSERFVKELFHGMQAVGKSFKVSLIGGDTVGSKDKVTISVTLLGEVEKDEVVFRHGANPGDLVYVSGFLGDSAAGLEIFLKGLKGQLSPNVENYLRRRHLCPQPRIELARKLAVNRVCTALNDISDGLIKKVWEIAYSSKVSIRIDCKTIPISDELRTFAEKLKVPCLDFALHGGEDYELLFTVAPGKEELLGKLNLPVTKIGQVLEKSEFVEVLDQKGNLLVDMGFQHF